MEIPTQVTFRDMEPSPAVEAKVREKAEKLGRFYDRVIGCRVVITAPHRHRHKGRLYNVRIDLSVPGGEIVVNREPVLDKAKADIYVAIRDAFDAAARRLEDHARRQRRQVKMHEPPPMGRVVKLFSDEGYGFIESLDGREIYFHRNSVLNGAFPRLEVGDEVRFVEEQGEKGLQASTVVPMGKRHPDPLPAARP